MFCDALVHGATYIIAHVLWYIRACVSLSHYVEDLYQYINQFPIN